MLNASTGILYGATRSGGKHGDGVIFSLAPPTQGKTYTETVLLSLESAKTGGSPVGTLLADPSGALYGLTSGGGAGGLGVALKLSPNGSTYTPTVLWKFNCTDGAFPVASLIADSKGALYGVTSQGEANSCSSFNGHGIVFKLTLK